MKCRWMDKAAISESSSSNLEPSIVVDLKHAKLLLSLSPLLMTFLLYGVVYATANTFFVVQSNTLENFEIGGKAVPVNFFFTIFTLTADSTPFVVRWLLKKKLTSQEVSWKGIHLLRINIGMAFSVLCCLAAWLVEIRRLENPINLSMIVLLPQFFLLGLMIGFAVSGLEDFFYKYLQDSMNLYGGPIIDLAMGIAAALMALFVLYRNSWFGDESILEGKLNKYFLSLMILNFVNFCVCLLVSYRYLRPSRSQPRST